MMIRKIISILTMIVGIIAFMLMFAVDGSGGFIDLSNVAIIFLGVISFIFIVVSILIWKSQKAITYKTKGILILISAALIICGGFIASYDRPVIELSMNEVIKNEPSITGIVQDVSENSILVKCEEAEYLVSLEVDINDSMTHFNVGDEVVVYYNGVVGETYPLQINKVYAITLKTPADRTENEKP